MEKSILEYKIICEEFARELVPEINLLIKEGWTPYHGLVAKDGYLYQIMVRYERYTHP